MFFIVHIEIVLRIDNSGQSAIWAFANFSETVLGTVMCDVSNKRAIFPISHDMNGILCKCDSRRK